MPNELLSTLWKLWDGKAIEPAHVVKALALYGYELGSLTNSGITALSSTERYEYKHGVRE